MLEDLFDRVCDFTTNTIAGYEGNLNTLNIRPYPRVDSRTVYTPPYLVGS
jgi:hypothetical protein